MNVTIEQVQAGLIKYIDSELAPKASGMTKFVIYFLAPSIPKRLQEKIAEVKQNTMFSDFFDEDGNIKLDDVYNRAKEAMKHSGKIFIKELNYFADMQDIEALYQSIKNS